MEKIPMQNLAQNKLHLLEDLQHQGYHKGINHDSSVQFVWNNQF
jgi:hypothetical protein